MSVSLRKNLEIAYPDPPAVTTLLTVENQAVRYWHLNSGVMQAQGADSDKWGMYDYSDVPVPIFKKLPYKSLG